MDLLHQNALHEVKSKSDIENSKANIENSKANIMQTDYEMALQMEQNIYIHQWDTHTSIHQLEY